MTSKKKQKTTAQDTHDGGVGVREGGGSPKAPAAQACQTNFSGSGSKTPVKPYTYTCQNNPRPTADEDRAGTQAAVATGAPAPAASQPAYRSKRSHPAFGPTPRERSTQPTSEPPPNRGRSQTSAPKPPPTYPRGAGLRNSGEHSFEATAGARQARPRQATLAESSGGGNTTTTTLRKHSHRH